MRFGMFDVVRWHQDVSAGKTLTDILDQIEFADQLGIQDIWLGEHHFSRHGLLSGIFSFMGAVAAYPAAWRSKGKGLLLGAVVLTSVVARGCELPRGA